MSKTILSVLAALAMGGCVGSLEPTGPGGGDDTPGADASTGAVAPKALFDSTVYPIISTKCIGCHSSAGPAGNTTGFVATDATQGYSTITSFTSVVGNYTTTTAGILAEPASGVSPHTASMESASDISAITAWLDAEVQARGAGATGGSGSGSGTGSGSGGLSTDPATATEELLQQWSGCMSQTNWDQATMATAWGNMTASNDQECKYCHVNAAEGFMASDQSVPFFTAISSNKFLMLQYFTVDLTMGTANAKVIINTTSFANVATGGPQNEHPRFNATSNQGMTALQSFYTLTTARMAAGQCDPSRLTD